MSGDDWLRAHLITARPRVLAALLRRFRDLDKAEDAFQEACLRALKAWPQRGVPSDPAAWLILTGRNAGIDALRRTARLDRTVDVETLPLAAGGEDEMVEALDRSHDRDDILRLMFMCCHPDLTLQDQLSLALKVMGGLSVPEIARAFLVKPQTLGQRITRAKAKAASIGTKLETPSPQQRLERLNAVALMLYLMFNEGYAATGGEDHVRTALCEEAIRLARLLVSLFPAQSEAKGLLALFLFQHSRRAARIDGNGRLVALDRQDRSTWDRSMIAEGEVLLEEALRRGRPGPYQIQAAIAGTHCRANAPRLTDWAEIERLYRLLERLQPGPIVTLNRAVAIARTQGAERALALLEPLRDELAGYLPFHATQAGLLEEAGRTEDAAQAYERSLLIETTEQGRAYLRERLAALRRHNRDVETGGSGASLN